MGGGQALGVEDVVALLPDPGLVEGGDGGEEQCHPEDAAGDLAGGGGVGGGVKGEREDDDNEQREEEDAVDGVAGSPLQAKVLEQVLEDVPQKGHSPEALADLVRSWRRPAVART